MSYFKNLFVAIDQLGNSLGAGNPDVTISARTGYFANIGETKIKFWWKFMELIINFAFLPFDGPNHCLDSYNDDEESGHKEGSDIARAFIGILIVLICPFIAIFTRIWVFIFPETGFKSA